MLKWITKNTFKEYDYGVPFLAWVATCLIFQYRIGYEEVSWTEAPGACNSSIVICCEGAAATLQRSCSQVAETIFNEGVQAIWNGKGVWERGLADGLGQPSEAVLTTLNYITQLCLPRWRWGVSKELCQEVSCG